VSAFYTGVAAIQAGDEAGAQAAFAKVTELAPAEPAAAANLAIVALEQHRLDDAADWVEKARAGAPNSGKVLMLAALIAKEQGRLDDAIADLHKATLDSVVAERARFLSVSLLEQRQNPGDVSRSRNVLDSLLAADPSNLFLRLTSARHAARHGQTRVMEWDISRLALHAAQWPATARKQLARVVASVGNLQDAGRELANLATSLEEMPAYRADRTALQLSAQHPDLVLTGFLALPAPSRSAA